MPSFIEKVAKEYSHSWKQVKAIPNTILTMRPNVTSLRPYFQSIDLWLKFALIPEEIKIIVFNKGNKKGFNGSIPTGGQVQPIHIDGEIDI